MPQRQDVYVRWAAEMRRGALLRPGERIGVAVSGGPDSVLLLAFMRPLAREMGLTLAVVHFNHHLRGAESDGDARFVRALASTYGLEFIGADADTAKVARERGRNLEATARELRYRFFFSLVEQGRLDKIATAHTANDQAETVLLRLWRGTSTRGLGGIYPVLEGKVIRPFLDLRRPEIEVELEKRKLEFRVDSSNRDLRLRRNKLRTELLPRLEKEFSPQITRLLKELADRAREDEAFLEQQAREHARPWRVHEGPEEKIPVLPLREFPPALERRVLRQMILAVQGSLRRVTHAHIEALRRFAREAQSGRHLILSPGLAARKEFDWLIIGPQVAAEKDSGFSYRVAVPGEVCVAPLGVTLQFKIVSTEDFRRAYNSGSEGGIDAEKLSQSLVLRNWQAGDRFRPAGSRKSWKLKELFRRRRIPLRERKLWPVLESGHDIVWVKGFPPASHVAATPGTKEIIVIVEERPRSS